MGDSARARLFSPARLGALELRNRVIKAATYEGMCAERGPSRALVRHHVELARGGVGMTTVAYGAVSADGRTFADQMYLRAEIVPALAALTREVHAAGARVSLQLGHAGGFTKNKELSTRRPLGPSRGFNAYGAMAGLARIEAMTEPDMARVADEFAAAAALARQASFDAVELHLGHGYLLSQFLSPAINRRHDRWGGSLDNRLRLPRLVVARVRDAVGPDFPILAKTNLSDGFAGGLEVADAVGVARALEADGVSALVLSAGFVSRSALFLLRGGRPLRQMIAVERSLRHKLLIAAFGPLAVKRYAFEDMFLLPLAREVRAAVKMPLVLLGGISSLAHLERAMDEGFDFVAMGRPLLFDPALVARYQRGESTRSGCVVCNECITEMERPGGVCCARVPAQLEARGREVRAGLHLLRAE
jgi:2,4-dienoyl-CoA reductase-like NADH-dependent reductase (Old Yellow Enzyme family)